MAENPALGTETQTGDPALTFANVDPNALSGQAAEAYKNLQADYTRKTQALAEERRTLEAERSRYSKTEEEFKKQSAQLEAFNKERQVWQSWSPVLQKINNEKFLTQLQKDPNFIEKILAGEQPRQSQQTGEQTVTRILEGIGDDDYPTAGVLNKALGNLTQKMRDEIVTAATQQANEQFNTRGTEAIRQLAQWMSETLGSYDKITNLRLAKQFGLRPVENAPYDTARIIEYMQQNNVNDPELAYQLAYGRQNEEMALKQREAEWQKEKDKAIADAVKKAREELALEMSNRGNGSAFTFGHMPTLAQRGEPQPGQAPPQRPGGISAALGNNRPSYGNVEKAVNDIIAKTFSQNR